MICNEFPNLFGTSSFDTSDKRKAFETAFTQYITNSLSMYNE